MGELSHVDGEGRGRMVDVSGKAVTARRAVARGFVRCSAELVRAIRENSVKKGNVLEVARVAGVMGGKKTSELVPMCHPLGLSFLGVEAVVVDEGVELEAEVRVEGKTGVEMEALTAVVVAALTVVDMGKAVDPRMVIEGVRVVEKSGGKENF